MTDRYRVYTKEKKMLKLKDQGQVVTLAMMISRIVMGRNAHWKLSFMYGREIIILTSIE